WAVAPLVRTTSPITSACSRSAAIRRSRAASFDRSSRIIGALMVIGVAADYSAVVHRALVTTACIMCALIVASFALFVRDQLKTSATHQANLIAPPTRLQYPGTTTTTSTATTPAHHQPGQPRRFIVGAAHDLTSPFDSIVSSR